MNRKDEKLLREYVRKKFVQPAIELIEEQRKAEESARLWVRSHIRVFQEQQEFTVINELKDSKPHPKTSINFLRDTFKKLLPNIESDYKSLTTSQEQRDSFRDHYLAATIRMFDQIDGLSGDVEAEDYGDLGAEPVLKDPDAASSAEAPETSDAAGPAEDDLDAMMKDLENLQEADDELLDEDKLTERDVNVVDSLKKKEEPKGIEGDISKEMKKNDALNADREKFGSDVGGDLTGRNKAYDSFKKTNNYIVQNFNSLGNEEDKEEFKKWCVYNLKLTFDGFDQELKTNPDLPNIADPSQQV